MRWDQGLFDVAARTDLPVLGWAARPLSRLADHSALWLVLAAALGRWGGRRGRRAALRGVGCIGAASLLVNQPAKRLFRRPRPLLHRRLAPRFLPVQLKSSSFPSGHSASAFAFAVGAGAELPRPARLGLQVVAGSVAFSRVYVGAHYPADVVAGSAVGAALGRLSLRLWPLPDQVPGAGPAQRVPVAVPALADGAGLCVVINAHAGSAVTVERIRELVPAAAIATPGPDEELDACLRTAAERPECRVLGIVGGDGSANCAIAVAVEHELPLLVLPGGTLNHLCRDLGLESIDAAVDALKAGSAIRVDVGYLDDEPFINTASFGGYPEFVVDRERMEASIGKLPAMLLAGVRALWRAEPTEVLIDGEALRVWLIFIGNCAYSPPGPAPSVRGRMDDGELDVRILDASRPGARLRLLVALLLGRSDDPRALRAYTTSELSVRALGDPVRTARDGEVSSQAITAFTVRKHPGQVVVYATADEC